MPYFSNKPKKSKLAIPVATAKPSEYYFQIRARPGNYKGTKPFSSTDLSYFFQQEQSVIFELKFIAQMCKMSHDDLIKQIETALDSHYNRKTGIKVLEVRVAWPDFHGMSYTTVNPMNIKTALRSMSRPSCTYLEFDYEEAKIGEKMDYNFIGKELGEKAGSIKSGSGESVDSVALEKEKAKLEGNKGQSFWASILSFHNHPMAKRPGAPTVP